MDACTILFILATKIAFLGDGDRAIQGGDRIIAVVINDVATIDEGSRKNVIDSWNGVAPGYVLAYLRDSISGLLLNNGPDFHPSPEELDSAAKWLCYDAIASLDMADRLAQKQLAELEQIASWIGSDSLSIEKQQIADRAIRELGSRQAILARIDQLRSEPGYMAMYAEYARRWLTWREAARRVMADTVVGVSEQEVAVATGRTMEIVGESLKDTGLWIDPGAYSREAIEFIIMCKRSKWVLDEYALLSINNGKLTLSRRRRDLH